MKHPLLRPVLAACAAVLAWTAAPASAQMIPEMSFYAEDIPFVYDSNPEPIHQPQFAGLNILNVDLGQSGYVYDFCSDFFNGNGEFHTYSLDPDLSSLTSIQQAEIRSLFSHTLPTFVEVMNAYTIANGGDWGENTTDLANEFNGVVGYAAGMQIALWEIVHEQTGDRSIDTEGAIPGSFAVEPVPGIPSNPRAEIGRANAEDFLTAIRNGTWTDVGGVDYFYVNPDAPAEQDRLWLTMVPEPSTSLLCAAGLLVALRRRRG